MKLESIKGLLQVSCDFNTSSIRHTFTAGGGKDTLIVNCIKETFILEVTSRKSQSTAYFTSIDEAANVIYEKLYADKRF